MERSSQEHVKSHKDYDKYKHNIVQTKRPLPVDRIVGKKLISKWDEDISMKITKELNAPNYVALNCYATSSVNQKFDQEIRKRYKNISQMINMP